ncbi:MAG: outer membrane protein assembly factor BamD, partial [Acidithiobacillus sp.]
GQRNLEICKFYYARHAYVAAADRCNTVITRYQLSPAREEALYYLARSYARMNLKGLAQSTTAVLAYNYPRSKYLGQLGVSGH